jgi:hypothetical protein
MPEGPIGVDEESLRILGAVLQRGFFDLGLLPGLELPDDTSLPTGDPPSG